MCTNSYYRDNLDIGNPRAAKKWESFTSDGPGAAWTGIVGAAQHGSSTVPLNQGGHNGTSKWMDFQIGETLAVMKGPGIGTVVRLNALDVDKAGGGTASASAPLAADVNEGGFATVMPYRGQMVFYRAKV